jgi:hypothetical protein
MSRADQPSREEPTNTVHTLTTIDLELLHRSHVTTEGCDWALARAGERFRLVALVPRESPILEELDGNAAEHGGRTLVVGPTSAANAAALRRHLPWLTPVPLGARTSVGMGDRLGRATPGHVRALRAAGHGIMPVFAQQSVREMQRTGRSPQQVLDDATWGAFQEGWRGGVGADADHLKDTGDIDRCLAAGFTLFTIDPGAEVDRQAGRRGAADLRAAFASLPWEGLEDSDGALRARYVGRTFVAGDDVRVAFDDEVLARAAVKYGRAVAHVASMFRHLRSHAVNGAFELEVSVDETDEPTSHAEHVYIARELRRLGVVWVSLAPRFVGRFEKGVDYVGDVGEFDRHFAGHAAIARALGPYKISLHSGSDKFSLYQIAAERAHGLIHLKTAGTSYLEALRTVAEVDPRLFRRLYAVALDRYERDRESYAVSGRLERAPEAGRITDADLPGLVDHPDARQILHVTFGSVLNVVGEADSEPLADALMRVLASHAEAYAAHLERHFSRHLAPFAAALAPVVG